MDDIKKVFTDVKDWITKKIDDLAKQYKMTKEEALFKYNSLLEYCKQDTWAMVVILDRIRHMVE